MSKENPNEFKIINENERLHYRLIINQLKQQLEEKDKLLKCYQDEERQIAKILGDKDLTIIGSRVHLENLVIELKNKIKDKDIVIEEKDKEIERLNTIIGLSQLQVSEKDRLNTSVNINSLQYNQTQLAITELEKAKDLIKHFCEIHSDEFYGVKSQVKGIEQDVCESIDYQIKILKGE